MALVQQWRGRWHTLILTVVVLALGAWAVAAEDPVEERMRRDITYLASAECEGRGPGTKGIDLAADYIAEQFKKAGLKPGAPGGSWFQPFTMTGQARLESPNFVKLRGPLNQEVELPIDKAFRPLGMSSSGSLKAPIVFVGYGTIAKDIGYDDFKDVDVDGKVILVLRRCPRFENPYAPFDNNPANAARHAALATKMVNAQLKKAAAIIFVNDRGTVAREGDQLMPFAYTASAAGTPRLPAVQIRRDVAEAMIHSSLGVSLDEIEQDIDRDLKPRSAALKGWTVNLEVNVTRPKLVVKNVVGVLEGNGNLSRETVVFGAHYDHLGYGGPSSLAKDTKPAIHHGADDNGSGTTMLIELARRFGAKGPHPRRLVFIAFSGEESGLLGSQHYCKEPIFPLVDTVAMLNMDMVGRLRPDRDDKQKDYLEVWGTGTAKTFDKLIDKVNEKHGFKLKKVAGGGGPSDHASFYAQKIPVFFFFTGTHPEYHRPTDTADRINIPGMKRIANLVEELGTHLASANERPEYVKVAGSTPVRPTQGPRLGIQPGYGEDKEGVLIKGVVEGGAADKAGLKEGDRIVEIAGKPVKDIQTYMVLMAEQKKGVPLDVAYIRGDKKLTTKVIPQ